MARRGDRSTLFSLLTMLGIFVPTAARSEVLDKYASSPGLWLAVGATILVSMILACVSRWTLLVTWPLGFWVFGFGLLQDFHSSEVGPAVFQEGGWLIAINWHLMALASAAWPLLLAIQRWKPSVRSGALAASATTRHY